MGRLLPKIRPCVVALLLSVPACSPAPRPPAAPPHRLTQVSVIDALMVGRYDGVMPIGELLRHGDFGLGTLDHLDGELIVLDGKAYQVRGDGVVEDVPAGRSTPFAAVTTFAADGERDCPKADRLEELEARLNEALPQKNHFVAVRIDGRFDSLTMRSVPRQEPPYRPLDEVAKGQSVWTKADQEGTLVGLRSPAWAGGLNVPGYHWHFLSRDRRTGGHVLDCKVRDGRVRHDVCGEWSVLLEPAGAFDEADLVKDRSKELHRVESSRGDGKD
ncbi:Alpha-acetolactate decarboxylase precursor [Aquisphaera giovannonii]|uniref:Alpha-acetolactate decarboxylase n=1 Tax=Aquisphaera giovannonii TaxID=406548 RepID=A0A5B9W6R6_9BACT|nr:acetolactate decarboxylase [Aquisphaera giovannonii]QEH35869.1 Alpha-acetolactate decarboxylase precursor [Aquisphaera giovannonii]